MRKKNETKKGGGDLIGNSSTSLRVRIARVLHVNGRVVSSCVTKKPLSQRKAIFRDTNVT